MTIKIHCEELQLHATGLAPDEFTEFEDEDAALEAGWWHDPSFQEGDENDDYWLCPRHAPLPETVPYVPFTETPEFTAWYDSEKQRMVAALGTHLAARVDHEGPLLGGHVNLQSVGWHDVALRAVWILDHPDRYPPRPPRPSELIMAEVARRKKEEASDG